MVIFAGISGLSEIVNNLEAVLHSNNKKNHEEVETGVNPLLTEAGKKEIEANQTHSLSTAEWLKHESDKKEKEESREYDVRNGDEIARKAAGISEEERKGLFSSFSNLSNSIESVNSAFSKAKDAVSSPEAKNSIEEEQEKFKQIAIDKMTAITGDKEFAKQWMEASQEDKEKLLSSYIESKGYSKEHAEQVKREVGALSGIMSEHAKNIEQVIENNKGDDKAIVEGIKTLNESLKEESLSIDGHEVSRVTLSEDKKTVEVEIGFDSKQVAINNLKFNKDGSIDLESLKLSLNGIKGGEEVAAHTNKSATALSSSNISEKAVENQSDKSGSLVIG